MQVKWAGGFPRYLGSDCLHTIYSDSYSSSTGTVQEWVPRRQALLFSLQREWSSIVERTFLGLFSGGFIQYSASNSTLMPQPLI